MNVNIRPRKPEDNGGWLCMPLCKNVPEGRKGWEKVRCPVCGQQCWKRPLQDETIRRLNAKGACCTLCALNINAK